MNITLLQNAEAGGSSLKKTVFIVCDGLNTGGAERQSLLLARELLNSWNPVLLSLSDGPLADDYHSLGIPVHILSRSVRFDFLSPVVKLIKLIDIYKPDILHSWGWMATIASAFAVIGRRIAHVSSTIRMGMVPRNSIPVHRLACRLGDATVANSHAGLRAWNAPSSRGQVVYNGFDWGRIPPDIPSAPSSDRAFRVLMTASMSFKKDWKAFVATAKHFCSMDNPPSIDFYGYGDGPCRDEILKEADDLCCTEVGLFLPGSVADPVEKCLSADVGVLLSPFGEGISNSIMEYMACGLPVICSDSGGNPELVKDGITGFLIDPRNPPEKVAEKILWLMENPDIARRMGQAGRKRIETDFSTERMVAGYVSIYDEVLKKYR